MDIFVASVQYDDFTGTVAADIADNSDLLNHLHQIGLVKPDERLAGIRIASSALQPGDIEDVALVAYLYTSAVYQERPAEIRAVETRISPLTLLSFYKRFDLVMVRKGMDLSGSAVEGPRH